ncbi:hypothetical protein CANARDRAFT_198693, partial [[Candida] arabinofermentans NRRL YB-2248]
EFGFKQNKSIQLFPELDRDELQSKSFNLLAISHKHEILICAMGSQLQVIPLSLLSNILKDEDLANENGIIDSLTQIEGIFKTTITSTIYQICLSSNEDMLFVIHGDESKILGAYDVSKLASNDFSLSDFLEFPSSVTDLKAVPKYWHLVVCLTKDHELWVVDLLSGNGQLNTLIKTGVTAFGYDFKIDGGLVYGSSSSIEFYNLIEGSNYGAPITIPDSSENFNIYCITEIESNSWLILLGNSLDPEFEDPPEYETFMLKRNSDDDNDGSYSTELIEQVCGPYSAVPRFGSFYPVSLHNWSKSFPHLFFMTASTSGEVTALTTNQLFIQANDYDRCEVPLDPETQDDDSSLGLVMDLSSSMNELQPCKLIETCSPLPRIMMLSDRGRLISWSIWYSIDINSDNVDLQGALQQKINEIEDIKTADSGTKSIFDVPTTVNPFGSTSSTQTNSVNPFGQSQAKSNPFGQSQAKSNPFGSNTSETSATNSSSFGQSGFKFGNNNNNNNNTNTNTPSFGKSSFGAFNNSLSTTSGSSSTAMTSSTGGAFGQYAKSQTPNNDESIVESSPFATFASPFGAISGDAKQSSPFGAISDDAKQSSPAFGSSNFGKTSTTASPFSFGSTANTNNTESPFSKLNQDSNTSSATVTAPFRFGNNTSTTTKEVGDSPFAKLNQTTNDNSSNDMGSKSTSSSESFEEIKKDSLSSAFNMDDIMNNLEGTNDDSADRSTEEEEEFDDEKDDEEEEEDDDENELDTSYGSDQSEFERAIDQEFAEQEREEEEKEMSTKEVEAHEESVEQPVADEKSTEQSVADEESVEQPVAETPEEPIESSKEIDTLPAETVTESSEEPIKESDERQVKEEEAEASSSKAEEEAAELSKTETTVDKDESSQEADKESENSAAENSEAPSSVHPKTSDEVHEKSKIIDLKVESDEVYLSKRSMPASVPRLVSLKNVVYPTINPDPVVNEMEKIVYDLDSEFAILNMNLNRMTTYLKDQLDRGLQHSSDSLEFPQFWRLCESDTVALMVGNEIADSDSLKNRLEFNLSQVDALYEDVRNLVKESKSAEHRLKVVQDKEKVKNIKEDRQLSFDRIQKRNVLRKKYGIIKSYEDSLQSKLLLLNSVLQPEKLIKNPNVLNIVLANIDSRFRYYFDSLKSIKEKLAAADKPKTIEEPAITYGLHLNDNQEKLRIATQAAVLANKKSLSESLKNRAFDPMTGLTISTTSDKIGSDDIQTKYLYNEPVQLTVKFHELRQSPGEVILDPALIPGAKVGDIGEIESLEGTSKKIYFVFTAPITTMSQAGVNAVANANSSNNNNNYISIQSGPVQTLMDLKLRSQVLVRVKSKKAVEADVVEVYIKDIHLSRGDMWNLSALLTDSCVYKTQRLSFLQGSIRGTVNRIYRNGKKMFSSYIGSRTKIVFRSESARLIFFIQISSEMWHFEESGQQMFHKLVNSLFPKVFQRWKDMGTHHLITIVLFTSVDLSGENMANYRAGEKPKNRKDYYRVVVDQVSILLWNEIMAALRLEFVNFQKDIKLKHNSNGASSNEEEYFIEGEFLPSVKGNLLEAINLGMSLVSDDFRDPDLRQTTNHFVIITPGTGIFDTDYNMLIQTSKLMTTIDSTIDVICLSQPPLHVVPLFRYQDRQGKLKHCIPSWMDISFWSDSSQAANQWLPRCKIYELQMMGVMENELSAITINELNLTNGNNKSVVEAMDDYDSELFSSPFSKKVSDKTKRRTSSANYVSGEAATRKGFQPPELIAAKATLPTTSNVTGVTTTSKSNVSAFSSLLSISKTDNKKTSPKAFDFVKRIISPLPLPSTPSIDMSASVKSNEDVPKLEYVSASEIKNAVQKDKYKDLQRPKPETSTSAGDKKSSIVRLNEEKNSILNSYWTHVENPSNAVTSELLGMVSYGRWQFVFPPNVKRRSIKWTSLSSPASLPIMTAVFPSVGDFNQNFTFRIYDVYLNQADVNEGRNSETLMRKMISLRLTLGFQICIGDNVAKVESQRKPNGDPKLLIQYLSKSNYHGSRIYLSLSHEIHRISCDYHGLINVQVYKRTDRPDDILTETSKPAAGYVPYVRTRYSEEYHPIIIKGLQGEPRNYNWNQLDQVLAGYDDAVEVTQRKTHRIKFVILPTKIPPNSFKLAAEKLTPEEIRLEGIRALITIINRSRYRTNEEKKSNKKVEITPEINFYTGNLFSYLISASKEFENSEGKKKNSLFQEARFNQKTPLSKIAMAIQGDKGIEVVDRKWHLRTHPNCFLGMELVSWMIENFEDIDTREQAVEFGNHLMDEHIFEHVESRHRFLDGHYFYHNNLKKILTSNTQTSATSAPLNDISSIKTDGTGTTGGGAGNINDEHNSNRRRVVLSRRVLCDLDPNNLSWQQELLIVHYDIVHNPEHCFHIRLEWLSNTSKLVEDTINGWAKHCELYGLTLVETPWEELCTLPIRDPLHSTIDISLVLSPWNETEFNEGIGELILKENKYFYHLYLLEKCGFLLDNRTATYFRDDTFDVNYSWGKPTFKYAQFIHKTGAYIAELRENGDFFLAPNNAHVARVNLSIGQLQQNKNKNAIYLDSQSVMLDFRDICKDEEKLRVLFREAKARYDQSQDVETALFEAEEIS